jgi:hypothetical protein
VLWLAVATVLGVCAIAAHIWRTHRDVRGDEHQSRLRELVSTLFSYLLLWFFWGVAAGLSASNLVGFGRDQMRLRGPWPYLLYFALDGAAAFTAVLIMRRARRDQPATTLRLFVWALIAGSAWFNEAHAPHNLASRVAFCAFPIIAAVLFEFALAETRAQTASRKDRRITAVRWLHPLERIRVQMALAADEHLSAKDATHRVRVEQAARRLYVLRCLLNEGGEATGRRARRAERRAQSALARVRFADPEVGAEVLAHVQVLARTRALASLDYSLSQNVRATLDGFLAAGAPAAAASSSPPLPPASATRVTTAASGGDAEDELAPDAAPALTSISPPLRPTAHPTAISNGQPGLAAQASPRVRPQPVPASPNGQNPSPPPDPGARPDEELLGAAREILAAANEQEERLTQSALARQLRDRGFSIANHRLAELAAQIGLPTARTRKDPAHA